MFNGKIKRYLNTEQIIIFSEPILSSGSEREDKRGVICATGEIVPTNRKVIENPFEVTEKHILFSNEYGTYDETFYSFESVGYEESNEDDKIYRSYRRTKNKVIDMMKCNKWEWFITLTFNPDKVNSFDYDVVTTKLSDWLSNMRRKCPDMLYVVVPEMHKSGRFHFHGLFSNVEDMLFVDSGKRDNNGRVIYNVGSYRLGFSTATQIEDMEKASSYVMKYITKEMCAVTKGKKKYWHSRNIRLPEEYEVIIENPQGLIHFYESSANYIKQIDGYMKVTYMELPILESNLIYTTNT